MKKAVRIMMCTLPVLSLSMTASADTKKGEKVDGREEFEKHCAVCHPKGGNPMKPEKSLRKKDMNANDVKNSQDIVKLMRKPNPGMPPFDQKTIDDKEAKAIAEYILKTFK